MIHPPKVNKAIRLKRRRREITASEKRSALLPFEQLPGGDAGGPDGEEEGEGGRAQQLSRHDDGHCCHCVEPDDLAINFLKTLAEK